MAFQGHSGSNILGSLESQ